MKIEMRLTALALLTGMFLLGRPLRAVEKPAVDVRALLEFGRAKGSLPEGLAIQVSACLGCADPDILTPGMPTGMRESWEFTANKVHRIKFESKDGKLIYHQVESHPFDTKGVCADLLDGKAIEIHERKGKGPKLAFVESVYKRGSRSISVKWKGETILDLGETNGPFLMVYLETDARAFGSLYERLASQARPLFTLKEDEDEDEDKDN